MFIIVVLLLLVGWGITVAVTWSGFRPQRISVTGTVRVDQNLIRSAARISTTDNIWLLNPWAIASRVDAIPYVLSLDLQRALPNRVTLAVHERRADSCLVTSRGKVTLDPTLRVLEAGCSVGTTYLLPGMKDAKIGSTLSDASLTRLRNDVAMIVRQRLAVQSASFDRDNGLVVMTRDGITLLLGEDATLEQTGALLRPILDGVKKQGRQVSQVDLRAPSTPVVRYKESSSKTEKIRDGA